MCMHIKDLKLKCAKCVLPHKTKNYGVKCGYYSSMGHTKDRCWKQGKDVKITSTSNNYLEVLVNNEEATLEQLNKICNTKHDIFSRTRILRRRLHVETIDVEVEDEGETKRILDFGRNLIFYSKMLHHCIKGKISLSPMETILTIPNELEFLKSSYPKKNVMKEQKLSTSLRWKGCM